MQILIVDAYAAGATGKRLLDTAVETLEQRGHDLERLDLLATGFPPFMTEEERRRYHDEDNICCPHVERSVALVR